MNGTKVFVDSDVVISSLLSEKGAAYLLLNERNAKAKFLLTYNVRHFNRQKISDDLGITVLTPAQYLQYLRSLE